MEENKKKRYGKRMRVEMKTILIEGGKTKTTFFNYPQEKFDRPENVIYHILGFLKTKFPSLDLTNFVNFCLKWDDKEADFILKSVQRDVLKRKRSEKL
ncbi:unnamed protein product [marine sediment metagenome]|uniref:Uncharacterized protein n=1 Tax=marine sediment metagenome TaxID=412755 RepID=X0YPY9_9ZZZZ